MSRNARNGKKCMFKDCDARVNFIERHALCHLPRMFADHDVSHQFPSYLFYFEQLLNVLHVQTQDELLKKVISEHLYPEQDYSVHPDELEVLREFQELLDKKFDTSYAQQDFKIHPPSVPAFAIHWKIQRAILNTLSDEDCLFLTSIDLGNLKNDDAYACKPRMRILSHHRLKEKPTESRITIEVPSASIDTEPPCSGESDILEVPDPEPPRPKVRGAHSYDRQPRPSRPKPSAGNFV